MPRRHKRFLILAVATLVTGCATPPEPASQLTAIEQDIQRAASEARAALQMLAQVRAAEARTGLQLAQKEELVRAATHTPPGMDKPITLSDGYAGPVEPLLRMLAAETGYRLEPVQGKPPLEAVIVAVPRGTYPAIVVLRDAAFQAAAQGVTVTVYDSRRTVRISHHG